MNVLLLMEIIIECCYAIYDIVDMLLDKTDTERKSFKNGIFHIFRNFKSQFFNF